MKIFLATFPSPQHGIVFKKMKYKHRLVSYFFLRSKLEKGKLNLKRYLVKEITKK